MMVAGLTLSLTGCFYPADRGRVLETRVDSLATENAQLHTELKEEQDKLSATLPKIDKKIGEVGRALEGLDQASHRSGADIGVQLQKNVEEVAQLRGQVDSYLHNIQDLETKIQALTDATDQKLTAMQGSDAVKSAEAKRKADEIVRPTDKREYYALAEGKAKGGEPLVARTLFAEFVRKWPRDELAGDAHFGIGETYFTEDKCREALAEYGKVVQDFPKSKAAPNAYVRSADCFKTLRMFNEGKLALEEVMKDYPRSEAARSAKTKLVELERARKSPGSSPGKKGTRK